MESENLDFEEIQEIHNQYPELAVKNVDLFSEQNLAVSVEYPEFSDKYEDQ